MKTAFITVMFVFIAISSLCQKNDTITDIEQKCQYINKQTNYQTVILTNGEFLDEIFLKQTGEGYGQMTAYLKNDSIYKIREMIGNKALKDIGITDYYFWKGKLIFVHEIENIGRDVLIDTDGTIDYKAEEPDFEGKYYFYQEKMFYKIVKGEAHILPNEKYFASQSKEGQLISSSQENINLFIKKKK